LLIWFICIYSYMTSINLLVEKKCLEWN